MQLNFTGSVDILHFALPFVPKQATSRLVFISSVAGCIGVPFRTYYCASKWALHGFAGALRQELTHAYGPAAPKVVVQCPPEVKSELNTGGRLEFGAGTPAESLPSTQVPTDVAVQLLIRGIAAGERYTHFSRMSSVLHALYTCLGGVIDGLVMKTVLKNHKTNGQGR